MNDNLEILADYYCNQNSKNKLTEIWYDVNTKMMMNALLYQKETIKINSELLSIIYNYNKLTTRNKPDGSTFKILAINNRYALIEEKSNDFSIYIIVQNGVSSTCLQFANLISAVNMYYKDFAA